MKEYRDFESAREFVRNLKLKNRKEWQEYCKSGNKPDDIPKHPIGVYKKKWDGVGDWLGTGTIASQDKVYRPFTEAREFVRTLNLKSVDKWRREYCKSGNKPDDIPKNPDQTYKNIGWVSYSDWLGTFRVANYNKTFRPFTDAREFVRKLNLNGQKEWHAYCKSGNKPDDIPQKPERTYKNEFKGYGDWLGTGNVATLNTQYRPFTDAREFVRKLNLNGQKEWREYCSSGNKPDDIPSHPWDVYSEWNIKRRENKK